MFCGLNIQIYVMKQELELGVENQFQPNHNDYYFDIYIYKIKIF